MFRICKLFRLPFEHSQRWDFFPDVTNLKFLLFISRLESAKPFQMCKETEVVLQEPLCTWKMMHLARSSPSLVRPVLYMQFYLSVFALHLCQCMELEGPITCESLLAWSGVFGGFCLHLMQKKR